MSDGGAAHRDRGGRRMGVPDGADPRHLVLPGAPSRHARAVRYRRAGAERTAAAARALIELGGLPT